ncbi:MAG: glycosyltransferase family 39 protein [Planctomycetaceae bacterium]|nr:glycosyltransferase family 39 protein [Planctomycetaceae bacterium]
MRRVVSEAVIRITSCGVVAGVVAIMLLSWFHLRFGLNSPPSATGDEASYDAIGWQLAQGNGFREDFDDPDFRIPYDQAATAQPELMTLKGQPPGIVTYRPPLLPCVIAVGDRLAGRQFFVTRIFNVVAISVAAGLLMWHLWKHDGLHVAIVGILMLITVDVRTRLYGRAILTESLAILLGALLTLALFRLLRHQRPRDAVAAGLVLGLSMLNRPATALWLPAILAGLTVLIWRHPVSSSDSGNIIGGGFPRKGFSVLTLPVILLLTACIVYGPWAVRNIMVLQRMMPLGAQGMMEMASGYSDEAWDNRGVWVNLHAKGNYRDIPLQQMSRIEAELAVGDASRERAIEWIRNHPAEILPLAAMKVCQEYRPRSFGEGIILLGAVVGMAVRWRRRETQVLALLHLANMMSIAATWSVEGRFVVPLLIPLHIATAQGILFAAGSPWLSKK